LSNLNSKEGKSPTMNNNPPVPPVPPPPVPAQCTAYTARGDPCSAKGKPEYDGLCKIHHNQLERNRAQQEHAQAAIEAERLAKRNRILTQNQQRMDQAPAGSAETFLRYARLIADLWITNRVPGDQLAQAYCLIRKTSVQHAAWAAFMRAVVAIINLKHFNPDELAWDAVPEVEITAAFNNLTDRMASLPRYDILQVLKPTDTVFIEFRRRRNEELEAERIAREAQAAVDRAARQAEWNRQQREEPVVFRRDPEGGIDLAALANDRQSIHRSSVQNATQKAVEILIQRPVTADMEALVEITLAFEDTSAVRFKANTKERVLMELTNDYYNTTAFNQPYGDILDRVWTYIRIHQERSELVRRLAQEVSEGIGMCENGKMAHLVNILYAYDAEITAVMQNESPPREAFQSKFATLLNLPLNERQAQATAIFNEYQIPQEERAEWLNPLLEG